MTTLFNRPCSNITYSWFCRTTIEGEVDEAYSLLKAELKKEFCETCKHRVLQETLDCFKLAYERKDNG